uniref:Uncharacterized protein n=1 Tax=Anguilla anguilla TaxID=7936 RepID=A0A0E9SNI6_ANGAN
MLLLAIHCRSNFRARAHVLSRQTDELRLADV